MTERPIVTKKIYEISKIKKLIDLNHDMINFQVRFMIASDNPFYAVIVDQHTLDNSEELEYKYVNDQLSGEIIADKNVYQNYYIVLKSEIPTRVMVELHTYRLPDVIEPEQQPQKTVEKPSPPPTQTKKPDTVESYRSKQDNFYFYLFIVAVAGFAIYYVYNNQPKQKSKPIIPPNSDCNSLLNKICELAKQNCPAPTT